MHQLLTCNLLLKRMITHSSGADVEWFQPWCEKKVKYLLDCFFCHFNNLVDVMAGVYTEKTLRALNKNQIIDLFLKAQEQTNTTIASLTAEIKRLNENFEKLESDVSIIKNGNNILSRCHQLRGSVGKMPSALDVNVLKWWGYLRQSKTKNLSQQSVGCLRTLVLR